MNTPLKILWVSNHPQAVGGYSQVTKIIPYALHGDGTGRFHVTLFPLFGNPGFVSKSNGLLVLPTVYDKYGNDALDGHMKFTQSELVITLYDAFVLEPERYVRFNWLAWLPIHEEPIYEPVLRSVSCARWIWSFSHWGRERLLEAGFEADRVAHVPLCIDVDTFAPVNHREAKNAFSSVVNVDLNSAFLIGMNGANTTAPSRKGFYEGLAAFKLFSDSHSDALLYIHTEPLGLQNGVDITGMVQALGINPNRVLFPDQYRYMTGMFPNTYMSLMYNACDVFMHCAASGGAELPVLEAQAVGCPMIASNAPSYIENVHPGNFIVPTRRNIVVAGGFWYFPMEDYLCDALQRAYALDNMQRAAIGEKNREFVVSSFSPNVVIKQHIYPRLVDIAGRIDVISIPDHVWIKRGGLIVSQ